MLASKLSPAGNTIALRGDVMAHFVPVYRVIIRPAADVGGYAAVCDMEKGGCVAQSDTIQEIQALMLESVAFYLEDYPEITNYCLEFEYCDA